MSDMSTPHIVMIEDNPADVQLFELALTEVGLANYKLTVLHDGGEALAWAASPGAAADAAHPDLTVVDLNLPKYSGIEIISTMRSRPELASVPVLVLSSSASPRDVARVQAFDHTVYMTKPVDLDQYIDVGNVVRRMLSSGSLE